MINWQNILRDLKKQYKSLAAIGLELDIHPKTLQKAAKIGRKDMMYSHGVKILELHLKHCKKDYIEMATKHSEEFRNSELQLLLSRLDKPKTRYDLEDETGIKSLWMKCERWVEQGKIYKQNQLVGKHLMLFYSATPFYEVPVSIEIVENVKTNSRIFRLTDSVHTTGNRTRDKVYVSGNSLGNF